jgi:hypothetical protein
MNRRKDGRELYEVFKEQMAAVTQPVKKEAAVYRPEPKVSPIAADSAVHTIRLGDRREVEVFLSLAWVYGLIFFVLLLVAGAFMVGRHFAPPPEQIEAVDAPVSFAHQAETVGDVTRVAVDKPQPPQPAVAGPANRAASVSQPSGDAAAPVEVSSGGMYTLCVLTNRNKGTAKAGAEDVVKYLKSQGLPDVRLLSDKAHGNLVVAVGSFATKDDANIDKIKAKVKAMSYKDKGFKDAYLTTLKGYE